MQLVILKMVTAPLFVQNMAKGQWKSDEVARVDTEEIQSKLKELSMDRAETRKANKAAIRKSLNIVRASVRKGAATVTSNREKQTKGVNLVVYKNGSGGQVNIYKAFYLNGTNRPFTLRWLEHGTSRVIGKNGKVHGATPAKPFFQQSVSSVIGQAENTLSENILRQIDIVASKRK